MKTSELLGPRLDWAVAKSEGYSGEPWQWADEYKYLEGPRYSTDWAVAGPIIERDVISVEFSDADTSDSPWGASSPCWKYMFGPTPLIAAMRCLVANKMGNEVDVPEGL